MSMFTRTLGVLILSVVLATTAFAESPVKLQNVQGTIDFSAEGTEKPFILSGNASHLGRFTGYGEAEFNLDPTGKNLIGEGVVVFRAANGDQLVGVVTWRTAEDGTVSAVFPWRDSVQFADGTIVSSTGRFQSDRPPGAFLSTKTSYYGSCTIDRADGLKEPGVFVLPGLCCSLVTQTCHVQSVLTFSR